MAATRQIAMAAQDMHKGIATEPELQINVNPDPIAVAPQQYVVFKLVNDKMNKFTLDGISHDVINPKTGEPETMRLIRGARSIWTTDLTELLKDKDYINKNRIGAQFVGGICRVPMHEKNKILYLRNHPSNVKERRNGSGRYDFYEYDANEEQKKKHDATMGMLRVVQQVNLMEEKKMIKLALFLGVRPTDDEIGIPRTPEGFRTELMLIAYKRHESVEKYIGSPEVEISALIRQAIKDNKIDLGTQNGNAIWAGGTGFICKIPSGEKTLAYLTQFAMTNSNEGRAFKEQLETLAT